MPSALSGEAVLEFIAAERDRIALLGLSRPAPSRAWRALRRSGPRLLPWLAVNYGFASVAGRLGRTGLPTCRVTDVNGEEFAAALRRSGAELLLTFHFEQIVAERTLALLPEGGINLHPSLLPRHRGPVPVIWAMAEGAPLGVTLHRLAPRIDAGALLAQRAVPLPPGLTTSAATRALHAAGVPLLRDALRGWPPPAQPVATLPYRSFPPPHVLRGRRLVGPGDLAAALRLL